MVRETRAAATWRPSPLRTHLLGHLAGDVLQRLGERLVLVDLLLDGLARLLELDLEHLEQEDAQVLEEPAELGRHGDEAGEVDGDADDLLDVLADLLDVARRAGELASGGTSVLRLLAGLARVVRQLLQRLALVLLGEHLLHVADDVGQVAGDLAPVARQGRVEPRRRDAFARLLQRLVQHGRRRHLALRNRGRDALAQALALLLGALLELALALRAAVFVLADHHGGAC